MKLSVQYIKFVSKSIQQLSASCRDITEVYVISSDAVYRLVLAQIREALSLAYCKAIAFPILEQLVRSEWCPTDLIPK